MPTKLYQAEKLQIPGFSPKGRIWYTINLNQDPPFCFFGPMPAYLNSKDEPESLMPTKLFQAEKLQILGFSPKGRIRILSISTAGSIILFCGAYASEFV